MKNNKFLIDYNFEIKETTEDAEYFYFEGYGSTKDLDLVNDIVEPTAFNESLKSKMPKLLWQHDRNEPIGVYTDATPDSKGLLVKGKMPLADDFVRGRVVPQMKIGSVDALSIGFIVKKSEWDSNKQIRTIIEADLLEVSLVTFPANPEARVTGLKDRNFARWAAISDIAVSTRADLPETVAPVSYRWDKDHAVKRVKAATEEQKETALDRAGVPVVDMINGAPAIIPRAVFCARAALGGARGGVDVDEETRKDIESIINKLYIELDLDPPFSGGEERPYCLKEITNLPSGYLGDVIRYKTLSRDAANFATNAIQSAARGVSVEDEKALEGLIDRLKKFNAR